MKPSIEKTQEIILNLAMDYKRLARIDYSSGIPMRDNWISVMIYIDKLGIYNYELSYINNLSKEQFDKLGFSLPTLFEALYELYYVNEYKKLKKQ